ncbi:Riboflavin biosynthesis protein RibD [Pseudoalteromonas sp. P1-9]|uniref:bifunctional diaminohydroxyphosphoribosylaminopyrimidine deaminase/5-amino-6-(5-phosphoribosylamino)uracil reductase RibD n=1 Tax=Pseudoalteromonas sp. P1-9 TaxID=1710354 RepID=UPI0006D6242D|nr:bifunctional diaminohydroxyphosphoribosylaminopyrimidine deaminase/5-amino-6-(5-phosphoribosylamino)uracil reductase RibD [Pseudoalteromonas sp. P1-9]KPV95430.1 Riboflavin biosynthesis protein RibD [Pseudoalteromonas sp. P1-9]
MHNNRFSECDHKYMARAIELAKRGRFTTTPNPNVGCVLVKDNQIIGEGFHIQAGGPHAEVHALKMAGDNAKGATAYVTLEPCSHYGRTPPCAEGLIKAGVSRVVAAMVDPNPEVAGRGLKMLEDAGIETDFGLLNHEAEALNLGFLKRMRTNLPYVRCKLAASLDGKTALENGESKWITSSESRRAVQDLRAESCAVLSGADTVIIDNAKLNVRPDELTDLDAKHSTRQPIRVIIDSQNRLTPDLALFQQPSKIIIARTTLDKSHTWPHFVEQVVVDQNNSKVDLHALLSLLAERGVNLVLLEAGATLAGKMFEQKLVDELVLFMAPKLMGHSSKSLINLPTFTTMSQVPELEINTLKQVGQDICLHALVKRN